jgi:hypothetical protein
MGIGFVIFIHLIALFFICLFLALVGMLLTRFLAQPEHRTRKIVYAALAPFIGLYTLYVLALMGSLLVSELKQVDVGLGDHWYVPLPNHCTLSFIDLEEQCYLEDDATTITEGVAQLAQKDALIYGKTVDSVYFSYHTQTKDYATFTDPKALQKALHLTTLDLKKSMVFYNEKRNAVAGIYFTLVYVLAFVSTLLLLWWLYPWFLGTQKPY